MLKIRGSFVGIAKTLFFKFSKHQYRKRRRQRKMRRYYAGFYKLDINPKSESNNDYINEINRYWTEHFGRSVHPLWHIACAQVTGREDARYISNEIWKEDILPHFNQRGLRPAFRDKNLSGVFLPDAPVPITVLKRIHGHYHTCDDQWISDIDAEACLSGSDRSLIIKPSQADNGYGIAQLTVSGNKLKFNEKVCVLADLERQYGADFIVQEKIIQHPMLAEPHPESVNTIRVVSFRWGGEIRVLLAFVRFGVGGRLTDNAGTGGVCCGIDSSGRLNRWCVDSSGTIYTTHPTTGYNFNREGSLPNYNLVRELAVKLHKRIFHFDIVSWDFAINTEGKPLFLEVNFQGAVDIYQFASGYPLFGDLTEEVLGSVREGQRWVSA